MRKSAKALLLVVVSLLGTIGLAIGSALSAALAFGAVALIVPGTGTPNANVVPGYLPNIENYYLRDTSCTGASCALSGINYPASFYPLAFIPGWCRSGPSGCDKWDQSVGEGADGGPLGPGLAKSLALALATKPEGGRDIIVFGYSQGGAVVSKVLNEAKLSDAEKQRIEVVTIGGIENPDGGLWQRLAFLRYIPIIDVTFDPPMPVDPLLKTTTIGFEYDPVVYAPRYWGNPLALLNAAAALATVHGNYLEPDGDPKVPGALPYGYTPPKGDDPGTLLPQLNCGKSGHPENCRYDSAKNTYIMIPATSLPIYDLLLSVLPAAVRPFVKPFIDLITPVTKVLVDLGYDWSGDPGTPTPLSILPFSPNTNFLKVGADLVSASIQGLQNFIKDLTGFGATSQTVQTTVAPRVLAVNALSRLAVEEPKVEQDNAIQDFSLVKGKIDNGNASGGNEKDIATHNEAGVQDLPNKQDAGAPVGQANQPEPGTPRLVNLSLNEKRSNLPESEPVHRPEAPKDKDDDHNVIVLNRGGGSQQVVVKKLDGEDPDPLSKNDDHRPVISIAPKGSPLAPKTKEIDPKGEPNGANNGPVTTHGEAPTGRDDKKGNEADESGGVSQKNTAA